MLILLRANRHTAWKAASFSHKAHLGVLLCEKRKPDGLFTFNKIILEKIVISQRNFLASSAILASKLIQEARRVESVSEEIRDLVRELGKLNKVKYKGWAAEVSKCIHLEATQASIPPVTHYNLG